jgi:hypothetical protein
VKSEGSKVDHAEVPRTPDGTPNVPAICEAYHNGYTVVLNALHRRWPAVASFRAGLSDDLGHPVGINLYLTPAGSQGFQAHMDGHDVFILQLDGPKRWEVYKPQFELPLDDHPSKIVEGDLGRALLSPELEPGDVLYIPRGFIHRARTTKSSSLHLTMGIHSWRWVDVLHRAVDALAGQDPSVRRSVPAAVASEPLKRQVRSLLRRMARAKNVDAKAVAAYQRQLVKRSEPVPGGRFAVIDRLSAVNGRTIVHQRAGVRGSVARGGQKLIFHFGDRSIEAPAAIGSALEFVAGHRTFSVGSLPGGLSDEGKLVLVRRLLREGFLVLDKDKGETSWQRARSKVSSAKELPPPSVRVAAPRRRKAPPSPKRRRGLR